MTTLKRIRAVSMGTLCLEPISRRSPTSPTASAGFWKEDSSARGQRRCSFPSQADARACCRMHVLNGGQMRRAGTLHHAGLHGLSQVAAREHNGTREPAAAGAFDVGGEVGDEAIKSAANRSFSIVSRCSSRPCVFAAKKPFPSHAVSGSLWATFFLARETALRSEMGLRIPPLPRPARWAAA
jgi:hypothetical protein